MPGNGGMVRTGSGRTKLVTSAQVGRLLKARGLKTTAAEIDQLTRMMNDDMVRERQNKAVDRFFDKFWAPVQKEQAAPKRATRKKP
jgi:hypothetical protein